MSKWQSRLDAVEDALSGSRADDWSVFVPGERCPPHLTADEGRRWLLGQIARHERNNEPYLTLLLPEVGGRHGNIEPDGDADR
jgi:hypothetical protein